VSLDPARCRVCVITDRRLARGRALRELVQQALAGGADMIQLRETAGTDREILELALELEPIVRRAGASFVVNNRVDIAVAAAAHGVHLGADDLPLESARGILGARAILGASARSAHEARRAEAAGADYLGVGPVYEARATKPDALAPQGVELLRRVRAVTALPILAIGGIDAGNADAAIRAGASGVAVVSAVIGADSVAAATAELRAAVLAALGDGARS